MVCQLAAGTRRQTGTHPFRGVMEGGKSSIQSPACEVRLLAAFAPRRDGAGSEARQKPPIARENGSAVAFDRSFHGCSRKVV